MREFFRGWKRKIGCVTLMMACVFAAFWIRAISVYAELSLPMEDLHPYFSVTIAYTIISACLLLSKPRAKTTAKSTPNRPS